MFRPLKIQLSQKIIWRRFIFIDYQMNFIAEFLLDATTLSKICEIYYIMHIYFRVHVYQVIAIMFSFLWFVKVRPSHKQLWFVQDRFPPSAPETIVRGTLEPPLKAPPQNALAVVLSGWHWMLEVICSPQQGQKCKN